MAKKQLSPAETAFFCEQLSSMLNAGMQLNDGLEILALDIDDGRVRKICDALSKALDGGNPLYSAMEQTGVFPEYAVNMVKIGTVSGRLDDVLNGLSEYYEARGNMMSTIRNAVLHPFMLLVMMTAVIIVLVAQVIPMFSDIFARFDSSVSESVDATVDFALKTGTVIMTVLLVIIGIAAVLAVLAGFAPVRRALSRAVSYIPGMRTLSRRFAQAQLANAMNVMVSAGISPEEALDNALLLIGDGKLSAQISDCRRRVLEGESFADAVCAANMFPAIYGRTLKIAYISGSFDKTWKKISERCSEQAENTASNLIAFIEPAMIVVLAAIIGSILLTIMIPLMNIMSVLG